MYGIAELIPVSSEICSGINCFNVEYFVLSAEFIVLYGIAELIPVSSEICSMNSALNTKYSKSY